MLQLPGLLASDGNLRWLATHACLCGHRRVPYHVPPQSVAQLCGRDVSDTPRPAETLHAAPIQPLKGRRPSAAVRLWKVRAETLEPCPVFVPNACLFCVYRVSSFVDNMEDDFAEVSASQAALDDDEAEEEGDDRPAIDDDVC